METYQRTIEIKYSDLCTEILNGLPDYARTYVRSIHNNTAPRTRYEYLKDIKMFLSYMQERHSWSKVTLQDLSSLTKNDFEEYFEYLEHYEKDGVEYSNTRVSIKRKMSALRKFFAYLFKSGFIQSDEIRKVELPKLHKKAIIRLENDEASTLLNAIENGTGLTEKELDNAWKYWESKGLVNLKGSGEELEVEFLSQIDLFYGKTPAAAAESEDQPEADESAEAIIERLTDQQLHEIFVKYQDLTGRTVSRGETGKLTDAVKLYNIEPDVLDFAIDYCIGIDKYSVDYICKVALRWTEEGARDVATVKKMLDQRSKRNDAYRKIFAALGFNRLPNPADREIMDKWFDDMGCTLAEALDACKAAGGMREPHLKYVSKVIENRMLEKGGINTRAVRTDSRGNTTAASASEDAAKVSRKVLKDYYEHIRRSDEASHRAKIAEVTGKLPEMKDLFAEETRLNSAVISMKPGPEARENRQRLRDKRKELEEKLLNCVAIAYEKDAAELSMETRFKEDLGGASVKMVGLVSQLENDLDVFIQLADAAACATIAELADKVEEEL